jgi:glutathionylspermidine synthase
LSYSGHGPAKLLEYNADTPTALFEASVFQWQWLEDQVGAGALPSGADQFNSLHEKLIARFREIAAWHAVTTLHLACDPTSEEDKGCVAYLADCAGQAGLTPTMLAIGQIGRRDDGPFVDLANAPIALVFKLYPWEWMFADAFAGAASMRATRFIEPPWKAVLSNKGILPILWEMAPNHPNLLEAYFADDPAARRLGDHYAEKPLFSREGSGIRLVEGMFALGSADGPYARGPRIRQALAPLPDFDGQHPVIGSWIIGEEPAGIGIREDASAITTNASRFVPHIITPSA